MEANKCENVETDKKDVSDEINEYINQMDELERKSYFIAKDHLESSFSLEKSIGFIKWKAVQEKETS